MSYNTFPSVYDGKEVYDYMINNNLIITKDASEHNLNKFVRLMEEGLMYK